MLLRFVKYNTTNRNSHSKKGAALIVVIVVMVIVSIFVLAFASVFANNLIQTRYQERKMEAFFLAKSGIELGIAALMQQGVNGVNDTLLYKTYNKTILISSTPTLTHTIHTAKGDINIAINALNQDGERWIQIQSVGVLNNNNITRSIRMQFLLENPEIQKWDSTVP